MSYIVKFSGSNIKSSHIVSPGKLHFYCTHYCTAAQKPENHKKSISSSSLGVGNLPTILPGTKLLSFILFQIGLIPGEL